MTGGADPSFAGRAQSWSASAPHQRAAGTLGRFLPDGLLLLGPTATEPIVMTGPAADVWGLVDTPISFEQVVSTLARRYDVAPPLVAADLEPVWDRLVTLAAVERP